MYISEKFLRRVESKEENPKLTPNKWLDKKTKQSINQANERKNMRIKQREELNKLRQNQSTQSNELDKMKT